ncbi:hypothetical protein K1719_034860 [Acacia pycnantha]|nr:hypothetical protein K1719_034860 [Acacia pycnantha]
MPKLGDNPVRFRFEKMNVSSGWVAQVEAAQVEPKSKKDKCSKVQMWEAKCCVYLENSRNPNRAFFGCHNFKEKLPYCDFFKWVDDSGNDSMELEDSRLNKLELNNAEVEFKLNYMEMKLNDELQVKLNEHGMKIREQRKKDD